MSVPADEPDRAVPPAFADLVPATPRELKGLIRDWRKGRATRNVWQALSDAYIALIAALMLGAMLVNVVLKAQRSVASCDSLTCLSARELLPWGAFAAAVAVALALSRLFGPVLASAAEGFWILDAPVGRAGLLRARLAGAIAAAFAGGAVVGGLVSALTGSRLTTVAVWMAATGLSAAAAVAFAAAQQGIERHRLVHAASYLFGALAVSALTAAVGIAAGWFGLALGGRRELQWGVLAIAFSGATVIASAALALARLGRIRRSRLLSGGAMVSGLSGAFFALDVGLARDIVVARRALDKGHVRSRRGKGLGLSAVAWREWQRLLRFPQPLLVLAATVVIPYATDALGLSVLSPVIGALALFGATIPLLNGLRVLTRTGGLARCLPFSLSQLKLASIAVPAALALGWTIATVGAYLGFGDGAERRSVPEALLVSLAVGLAGLLAAVRWTQAKGPDFGAPMVSSQLGAFPPGLVTNLFRGFDVALVTTAPLLLGGSPLWSLGIAGIVALILLNSLDAESLRARQAEQQKELAAQRKQRDAAQTVMKQRKR